MSFPLHIFFSVRIKVQQMKTQIIVNLINVHQFFLVVKSVIMNQLHRK